MSHAIRGVRAVLCLVFSTALAACGAVEVTPDAAVDAPPGTDAQTIDAPPIDGPNIDAPPGQFALTVTPAGTGTGTVTSAPAGINCGSDCTELYSMGTIVVLTASANSDSMFAGWSGGGCTGTGTCTVTVNAATTVTATFDRRMYTLTVNRAGNGSGTVTSSPAGINCGATCQAIFNHGQVVTLTATPTGTGNVFSGWSGGGCSGAATTCQVTLTAATTVTATFDPAMHTLTVSLAGSGTGTVTSAPAGINCPGDCSQPYNDNTMVTLTATRTTSPLASVSNFAGWSGGCSGMATTCTVTMTAATTVTARFDLAPNFAFVTSTSNHTGNLGGIGGADSICQARAAAAGLAGTYRAWLTTSTTNAIDRLAPASGWIRPDGRPLANTRADIAAEKLFHPMRIDELGSDVGASSAHTATTYNGTRHPSSTTCNDYTTALAADTLIGGATDSMGAMWTIWTFSNCAATSRLYCFGIDRAATVVPTAPASYRRAFTSEAIFTPGGGIAAADAICQNEASAAGLSGTYRALLATTTASAASRFNSGPGTLPWGRPDGVLLAPTAAEVFTATLQSAPNTSANQNYAYGNYGIWGGATSATAVGTAALTCTNWTVTTGSTGGGGRAGGTSQVMRFSLDTGNPCNATYIKLVCLQE